MAVIDAVRFILVVQFVIFGLYSVVSEQYTLFASVHPSDVIKICHNKEWQQYQVSPGGTIEFLTADMKRRILYWITEKGFFSQALDGNKQVVNLSEKFRKGLVYQGLLQRAVTLGKMYSMDIKVHDGQIIFAAYNWGLMKFDVETNKKLYSLQTDLAVTKYNPNMSIKNMEACGNNTCLYWHGPVRGQISSYLINSNINQILVQRSSDDWTPLGVYEQKVYWYDSTGYLFTTDIITQNKVTFFSPYAAQDQIYFYILSGIMYFSDDRLISSEIYKHIYVFKSYFSNCSITPDIQILIGIPASDLSTNIHQNVDDDDDDDDDEDDVDGHGVVGDDVDEGIVDGQGVEDAVKTNMLSRVGWSLGIVFTLLLLLILCYRLVKMIRNRGRETNPKPMEHVYTLTTRNVSNDNLYIDTKLRSEPSYTEITG